MNVNEKMDELHKAMKFMNIVAFTYRPNTYLLYNPIPDSELGVMSRLKNELKKHRGDD